MVTADTLAVALATVVAVRLSEGRFSPSGLGVALCINVPVVLTFLGGYGLYRRSRRRLLGSSFPDLGRLVHACLLGTTLGYVVGRVAERTLAVSRIPTEGAVIAAAAEIVLVVVLRMLARFALSGRHSRVLIVGSGMVANNVLQRLDATKYIDVVGCVDNNPSSASGSTWQPSRSVGGLEEIPSIVAREDVDHVLVAFTPVPESHVAEVLRSLEGQVRISVVPRMFDLLTVRSTVDDLAGLPVIDVAPATLGLTDRIAKRSMDVLVSSIALLLLSPLMLTLAVVIRVSSPGPAIFRQTRIGRGGRAFEILKFRTMRRGSEAEQPRLQTVNEVDGPLFKIRDDPRVTPVGRLLRRTSLDELPQLFNVLRSDMSLVGPRPFVTSEANDIEGWAARRYSVRPGITGLWQVSGRSDLPYAELCRLDYSYVASWSLGWDLRILWHTPAIVFRRRGAY
ncbi:MAG: sugar transferase [Acidimicrobiales bacterium]